MFTYEMIDNVLEIYFNETDDYDVIADRCNISVLDVANIINDYMKPDTQKIY